MYIFHILLICSSDSGHLSVFYLLALLNNGAKDTGDRQSLLSVLLRIYLGLDLLGHTVIVCLVF